MIAALPMYLRPATRAAHDALWRDIRDRLRSSGIAAPDELSETPDPWTAWEDPALLLGQVCNLPWRARLKDRLTLVGSLDYGLPGTAPGLYHSVMVVREDATGRPATFALNDTLSQSGYGAPLEWLSARGWSPALLETGSHAASVAALKNGRADISGIDAITWRLLREEGLTDGLRILGRTAQSPGMSLVTAFPEHAVPLHDAAAAGIEALHPDHAAKLGLRGIVRLPASAFDIPLPGPPLPQGQPAAT